MTHTLPQLLPHCGTPAQQFCGGCRDREGGRAFRAGVLERQGIEGVHVDFDCPKGKPWGVQMPPDADIRRAIKRADICRDCDHGSNVRLTVESKRGIEAIFKVKCDLCSSCGGGLSLTKGRCKAGKWNK